MGFPCGSADKESACNAGDLGSIPRLGRSSGEGNGYPLQYSGLENPINRGTWWATVHGVAKSRTELNNFHKTICLGGAKIYLVKQHFPLKPRSSQGHFLAFCPTPPEQSKGTVGREWYSQITGHKRVHACTQHCLNQPERERKDNLERKGSSQELRQKGKIQ